MAKFIKIRYVDTLLAQLTKLLILVYQLTRIFRPSCCRFYPSCSDYCLQALGSHGFFKGLIVSLKRLAKCHPWHPGGVDMVRTDTAVGKIELGKEPSRRGNARRDEWNKIEAALI